MIDTIHILFQYFCFLIGILIMFLKYKNEKYKKH